MESWLVTYEFVIPVIFIIFASICIHIIEWWFVGMSGSVQQTLMLANGHGRPETRAGTGLGLK